MTRTSRPTALSATTSGTTTSAGTTRRTTAALGLLAVLVTTLVVAPAPHAAAEDVPGKLLLVLDASGSMADRDPSGLTKMAAAQRALTGVVTSLPDDATVGLRVYGAKQPGGKPTPAACADTQLSVPLGTIDKPALIAAIRGYRARGETPIAYSLTQAMKDLGTTGKRNIVLVSDGEESCVPDPCPVVRKLVGSGIDLQIDTVGFGVDAKARQQLQCVADAGRGSYYDAADADALSASLSKLSQRALRPFTVTGTPVRLSPDTTTAPELAAGQYVDTFVGKAVPRYGRITRTPGSTVRVAVMTRPPLSGGATTTERWTVAVTTPDGERCARESAGAIQFYRDGATVVSTVVNAKPGSAREDTAQGRCGSSPDLLLAVSRDEGSTVAQPAEILVMEEPPVAELGSLPQPLADGEITALTAERSGDGTPVVGGGSFSDSLELAPGTYRDVLVGSEQLFYRVRLEEGQRAAFTADVPAPGTSGQQPTSSSVLFALEAYTPARVSLRRLSGKLQPVNQVQLRSDVDRGVIGEFTPEIRYRNREVQTLQGYSSTAVRGASIAGYYYFAISRDSTLQKDELQDQPIPIRFAVAVEGEATGKPQYDADAVGYGDGTPTGTPTPASTRTTTSAAAVAAEDTGDDSGVPWLYVIGGVALVAVLGALLALLVARARQQRQPGGGSHA